MLRPYSKIALSSVEAQKFWIWGLRFFSIPLQNKFYIWEREQGTLNREQTRNTEIIELNPGKSEYGVSDHVRYSLIYSWVTKVISLSYFVRNNFKLIGC